MSLSLCARGWTPLSCNGRALSSDEVGGWVGERKNKNNGWVEVAKVNGESKGWCINRNGSDILTCRGCREGKLI